METAFRLSPLPVALLSVWLAGCGTAASSGARTSPAASSPPPNSSAAAAIPTIPASQPVHITIATGVPSASFTSIWIALEKGYFKAHGLDVKHERIEGVIQSQAI